VLSFLVTNCASFLGTFLILCSRDLFNEVPSSEPHDVFISRDVNVLATPPLLPENKTAWLQSHLQIRPPGTLPRPPPPGPLPQDPPRTTSPPNLCRDHRWSTQAVFLKLPFFAVWIWRQWSGSPTRMHSNNNNNNNLFYLSATLM
jgi:hypothetical protein